MKALDTLASNGKGIQTVQSEFNNAISQIVNGKFILWRLKDRYWSHARSK